MSQNDFTIANQGFPAFRADLNSALQALASSNSGATAPSTTFANQLWYDTANNILYIRNEDNDAWIKLFTLDQTNDNVESLHADTIAEATSGNGVAVDGVTLKDGELGTTASPVAINSSSLNGGQFGGRRNIIINGAMQVAQRGTSVTSISTEGYKTVDRFKWTMDNTSAVFTHSQSTDVPTGEGFANSFKVDVTTADTSLASGNQTRFEYRFEGQDVQQLAKGTSNAKKVTLSFWVKAYQTGTYVVNIHDTDNSRLIAKTYTVNSSATWEYKTITFDGDATGTLNDDNALSLVLHWYLGAGSDYTSGTLATSWESFTNANRAVGQTVDIASSTSNYWQITGVQLEVGEQATPFEHKSFGEELALCQRYAVAFDADGSIDNYSPIGIGRWHSATDAHIHLPLPVTMRYPPTLDATSTTAVGTFFINTAGGLTGATPTSITLAERSYNSVLLNVNYSTGGQTAGTGTTLFSDNADVAKVVLTSEL